MENIKRTVTTLYNITKEKKHQFCFIFLLNITMTIMNNNFCCYTIFKKCLFENDFNFFYKFS